MEKKKKREKERRKTDGFDLKHDIMAWIVSRLTFPQAKYLQREREREFVGECLCIYLSSFGLAREVYGFGSAFDCGVLTKIPLCAFVKVKIFLNLFSFFFWKIKAKSCHKWCDSKKMCEYVVS